MAEPSVKHGKKLGGIDTKWWIIGGIGTAGIVYVLYKRQSASAATATVPTDTSSTIDPNTGLPYGDYSAVSGVSPSLYGYTDPTTGAFISGGTPQQTVTSPTTNASWFQQAEAYLVQQGYDNTTAGAALGKYLAGGGLTNDQLSIVQFAIGAEGYPPIGVPAPHVNPPAGQTTKPPPVKKPIVPKGTRIGTLTTRPGMNSVPEIANYAHTSSTIIIALNAAKLAPYNVHSLPSGLKIYYPTTKTAGTFTYNG